MPPKVAVVMLLAGLLCASARAAEELTAKHHKAIKSGKEWLVKAQNKDGSWGMDHRTSADVAATALCGLALLSSGATARDGYDTETIQALQKAVEFLLARSKKTAGGRDISEGETSEFQTYVGKNIHSYFTVLFLSQVYGMRPAILSSDGYDEIRETLGKFTDLIAKSQDKDGSWHKETYSSLQATAVAWMSLRSANSTGVPIKHAQVDKTLKFIRRQYQPGQKMFCAREGNGNAIYDTASAIRILYGSGLRDDPSTRMAVDHLLDQLTKGAWGHSFLTNTGEDYPAAMMLCHALVQEGGSRWERWFKFCGDRFLKLQNKDGSWTATSCLRGRTVPTACGLLCLQTPYRLLPLQDL